MLESLVLQEGMFTVPVYLSLPNPRFVTLAHGLYQHPVLMGTAALTSRADCHA